MPDSLIRKTAVSGSGSLISLFAFFVLFMGTATWAQHVEPDAVMQSANNAAGQINQYGDEQKAKYAENIDKPYIPVRVNPDYTSESVKTMLIKAFEKYVNYYFAAKVPAYQNTRTKITIKNVKNGEVTDDFIRFTSGKENHYQDTITVYFRDILNDQIIYYVKVTEGGFYMPYVKVKDHLLTCGGKEVADLIFFMQHQYAVKYYEQDLDDFKRLAAKYHAMSEKPDMSEEQRKLFVQGNAMNDRLNYGEAIVYYSQAVSFNPLAYPEGYYNFAIIASLAENYELAILNMKKYLLLLPEAPDASSAQDKIYEWEAIMTTN
jgi:tetratricopeptide (TPR) repeat protein